MIPEKPLPYSDEFSSVEDYIEALLEYTSTTDMFQILCGGVHILDFFTTEPGLFKTIIPESWQPFLVACNPMDFLDVLLRDDLDSPITKDGAGSPPEDLVTFVRDVRRLSLRRSFVPKQGKLPVLPRQVALGMNIKKVHEVTSFAGYVDRLMEDISTTYGQEMTHLIDFGSGQNYLGRTLASEPYNKHIIAVEGREENIAGAKNLDLLAGLAEKEKAMRNKKVYQQVLDQRTPKEKMSDRTLNRVAKPLDFAPEVVAAADMRPIKDLELTYVQEQGKGYIHYVHDRLENADMTSVIGKVKEDLLPGQEQDLRLMAISIHSCGNLSHFGIRSMVLNPDIRAVAIVGCCYNLMTEKLGPPTYKIPYMRPSLQAINGRVARESEKRDPQGFPMSQRLCKYKDGVRLNITARMMACQAPENWTESDSQGFFVRHFYRAVLQKLFLDKGVINKIYHDKGEEADDQGNWSSTPFNTSTNPVIIGSLRKGCYTSFHAYVRGAIKKLTSNSEFVQYSRVVREKMGDITDEEISEYERAYGHRKNEIAAIWSLMAFCAGVVESLIVADRWLFLKEHTDLVQDCWAETVFDYKYSPRNLVVVGIKK
ncbi:uncharacterized protein E0L32_008657 [Thyridium curvatum]|uniref:Methyltransferase domain-containing protein n=1 Tax=Thyridium curvatum TaxID=1093900 RepID=A0A507B0D2_9PEZI|nr:uncharacterized protein E0L32_008657 [Thyridium curvatum]TPX10438.1 hypothetical protein E0L32_008657 [Thyridium curvatum]